MSCAYLNDEIKSYVWSIPYMKLVKSYVLVGSPPLPIVVPASTGQGLQISAQLTRRIGQVFYSMLFENNTQVVVDGFMIQFNENTFGLAAAGPLQVNPYVNILLCLKLKVCNFET